MSHYLSKIRVHGFQLKTDGINLVITPKSELTDSQLAFLKSHKADIIAELIAEQAANENHHTAPLDDRHYCRDCANAVFRANASVYFANGEPLPSPYCAIERRYIPDSRPRHCESNAFIAKI